VNTDRVLRLGERVMRTTVEVEDALLEKAAQLTGGTDRTALVRLALEALIARESAKRPGRIGGGGEGAGDDTQKENEECKG
jgi:Arc/MetJ family transcription regulator